MRQIRTNPSVDVMKNTTATVVIFSTCFILVSALTKNAFPGVEEWATYGHKSQVRNIVYWMRGISSIDPRYTTSAGSLAFFPIGWIDWPLTNLIQDPVLALRLSISSFLFCAGIAVFFLAQHVGCSPINSMFAALCWLSTVFSMSSWTSMPRLFAIVLFCFLFIGGSTGLLDSRRSHMITLTTCICCIAVPANPPALFAALLGLPLGFVYGSFNQSRDSVSFSTKLKKHLWLYVYPLTIFGPIVFMEWTWLRVGRPEVKFDEFDFSWKLLLDNAIGRGFWWEYASEGTTRYTPFIDAFDSPLVRLGMLSLVSLAYLFILLTSFKRIAYRFFTDGKKFRKTPPEYIQARLLGLFSVCFLFLSSAPTSIPGFTVISKVFPPLQMFREPFAKFNGIYLILVILTFFLSLQRIHISPNTGLISKSKLINRSINIGLPVLICMCLLSVASSSSFSYEKDSRAVISVDKMREIGQIADAIDSEPYKSKELCIFFSGIDNDAISWEQANTERILMALTSKQSATWIIPGSATHKARRMCNQGDLVIEISLNGEVELKG